MDAPPPGEIDGRGRAERDLLLGLRELLRENAEREIAVAVLVGDPATAKRVASFCALSHLDARVTRDGDHWRVAVAGTPCRCFT